MLNVKIREASEPDIEEIRRIYNDSILNSAATFDIKPKTKEDRIEWLKMHQYPYCVLVAVVDETIAGWGTISPYAERAAYIHSVEDSVYIDNKYRGKGIGTEILISLIEVAKTNGHHAIISLIVGDNDLSIHIHKKLGFEKIGVLKEVGRKFDQWLDLHIYEKLLS